MRLMHLAGRGFRNLAPFELDTDADFVVFHGPNAQGKTNALEAIYWLATLKPLRARRSSELVAWGSEEASVGAGVEHAGATRRYRVDLKPSGRRVSLDGELVTDLAEYFGGIRAIAFAPQDAHIVHGEPRLRRRWLDRAAFTASPAHLEVARSYQRALVQKGAALRERSPDRHLLDVLDDHLAELGSALVTRRIDVLDQLRPEITPVHEHISGGRGELGLRYSTVATGSSLEARRASLRECLALERDAEIRRQSVLVGPQRDRVSVLLDGRSARDFGSQGQVRSIVLALKLGELVAARRRGDRPFFLLDDVSSELDARRTGRLVEVLEDLGVQVFASTTDTTQLRTLPEGRTRWVEVQGGSLEVEAGRIR